MANGDVKPGYKTTEFWITVTTSIIGLLKSSGIITAGGDGLLVLISAQIMATIPLIFYILGRNKVKSA